MAPRNLMTLSLVLGSLAGACADMGAPAEDAARANGAGAIAGGSTIARGDDSAAREARRAEREDMVEHHIAARGVRDPRVLAALAAVPREWFVPPALAHAAYEDAPLPIGEEQTISQPYIVACMTEALELEPGARVLEIGTGSGYQAAVLAELTPHVWSIEIVPALARAARATLQAHGYGGIALREGDGYAGWPEAAPFDAIIVTAAPPHVPPALLEQLAPGGRMCIPVGDHPGNQELLLIRKDAAGALHEERLLPVRFVPMTGEALEPR
jgi:protein-L-isoaspartate(D-aspartate) O-methyltransferase